MSLNIFISHVSHDIQLASEIAKSLKAYGINAFVAHENIEPTAEWQKEIENFLSKMDCMLCLLSQQFKSSFWCNQEVGYCLGKSVPLISIDIGDIPRGFIGKWQAYKLPRNYYDINNEVSNIIDSINKHADKSESIKSWVVQNFRSSHSYNTTNKLCDALEGVELNQAEVDLIKSAFIENKEVRFAYNITKVLDEDWVKSMKN